jgi:MFS family permease
MSAPPPDVRRGIVIVTLGLLQILAWGSTFYLLTVLAPPIAAGTGWPPAGVIAGISLALLVGGFVSPKIGRVIQQHGGRPVLAVSSVLFAAGLAGVGFSPNLPSYLAAWIVMGVGMGAGLYDPAFATLGRQFGRDARRMITAVTLFGGFASTVCWPITALLLENFGWRTTCLVYAVAHLCLGLPAYLFLLPRTPPAIAATIDSAAQQTHSELPEHKRRTAFILVGAILTVGAGTLSLVSTHLLTLLQSRGFELAAAVALGALIGPSQVAARVIEITAGKNYHPVWTMLVGVGLVAVGIVLLWINIPIVALALIAYGAGNGIASIVRGAVPLILFGPATFAVLMGKLSLPILVAMAAAPTIGALLIGAGGAALTFGVLMAASLINVALAVLLTRYVAA